MNIRHSSVYDTRPEVYENDHTGAYDTWLTWTEDANGTKQNLAVYEGYIDIIAMRSELYNIHFQRIEKKPIRDSFEKGRKAVDIIMEDPEYYDTKISCASHRERMKDMLSRRWIDLGDEFSETPNKFRLYRRLTKEEKRQEEIVEILSQIPEEHRKKLISLLREEFEEKEKQVELDESNKPWRRAKIERENNKS